MLSIRKRKYEMGGFNFLPRCIICKIQEQAGFNCAPLLPLSKIEGSVVLPGGPIKQQ